MKVGRAGLPPAFLLVKAPFIYVAFSDEPDVLRLTRRTLSL